SEPPSTSPRPTTTELPRESESSSELNNSVYGSLTVPGEKKKGNKPQSNLNDIGKSEQKAIEMNKKQNMDWSQNRDMSKKSFRTVLVCQPWKFGNLMNTIPQYFEKNRVKKRLEDEILGKQES
ncbi:hypothetical protein QAD02_015492, partial [Eretmocerus hayati]